MELLVIALAVWRLSSLLVDEEGPFLMFVHIRRLMGVSYDEYSERVASNEAAKLFLCLWCMSMWVGIAVSIFYLVLPEISIMVLLPFSLSAAAILVSGHVGKH